MFSLLSSASQKASPSGLQTIAHRVKSSLPSHSFNPLPTRGSRAWRRPPSHLVAPRSNVAPSTAAGVDPSHFQESWSDEQIMQASAESVLLTWSPSKVKNGKQPPVSFLKLSTSFSAAVSARRACVVHSLSTVLPLSLFPTDLTFQLTLSFPVSIFLSPSFPPPLSLSLSRSLSFSFSLSFFLFLSIYLSVFLSSTICLQTSPSWSEALACTCTTPPARSGWTGRPRPSAPTVGRLSLPG